MADEADDNGNRTTSTKKTVVKRRRVGDHQRIRKKTQRYGQTDDDANKNDYFDSQSDESPNESSSSDDTADTACDDTQLTIALRTQIAQMEAKLEEVSLTSQKILRMVISLTTNRNIVCDSSAIDFLSIFPLKTEDSVDKFEEDLSFGAFRNAAMEHLCTIHGTNGTKDGGKIIRSVVYAAICPSILKTYTWTGNSPSGHKRDFNKKTNIFVLFFNVINAYDKSYTKSQCEADLKKRIFKYVKTAAGKIATDDTQTNLMPSTSSASTSIPLPPEPHDQNQIPPPNMQHKLTSPHTIPQQAYQPQNFGPQHHYYSQTYSQPHYGFDAPRYFQL